MDADCYHLNQVTAHILTQGLVLGAHSFLILNGKTNLWRGIFFKVTFLKQPCIYFSDWRFFVQCEPWSVEVDVRLGHVLYIDSYTEIIIISCTVISFWQAEAALKANTFVSGIAYRLFLSLPLSLHLWVWAPSPLLLSSDSRLFSPTLSRDLIEGNHSHKKPSQWCCCTCVYMSTFVRAPFPSSPATTSPLLLSPPSPSPPPLKCHVALSTLV